ncbi:MAG: phospho-sugar mutase [Flavobacteriaceae bacterium]|tara:strand:+ start:6964 stop:8673 length:1710 start_codon:yes stop_codon:yes gene_type:complete
MNSNIQKRIEEWSKDPFCKETILELSKLKKDPELLYDSFYKELEFGTGGMRGISGVGTNRINKYTIGRNTQGIANYINKIENGAKNVVIAYDCRNDSEYLAKVVANIFSANNIKVFLFSSLRPTPELSFAVKKLNCICGIVLTASHNPPEYNGYKVYWKDGGQIVPPIDGILISRIMNVNFNEINFKSNDSLIQLIDKEFDELFIDVCLKNSLDNRVKKRSDKKIVFTSLHGTATEIMPNTFKKAGYSIIKYVEKQMIPDGNFSTVKSPNPEEIESFEMALKIAKEENSDLVIATDPDSDRLGIAVRDQNKNLLLLNGNQLMIVVFDYLLNKMNETTSLDTNYFIASTIVSTPMIKKIGGYHNVDVKLGLTGFKWIAKMIEDFPDQNFIAGGEESYGIMIGSKVRDKDAISATLLVSEMMSFYSEKNSSVFEELIKIYQKIGFYKEKLISVKKTGEKGLNEINEIMSKFRYYPIKKLNESRVKLIKDYKNSEEKNLFTNKTYKLEFPKSNVLEFEAENGYKLIFRPSGTEPKIKMYISVNTNLQTKQDFEKAEIFLENEIDKIVKEINL